MNSEPIVFVHKLYEGAERIRYFVSAATQAARLHPERQTFFISDRKFEGELPPEVHCVSMAEYQRSALLFAEHYLHISTNSIEAERFCLERWFVLRDFLRQHKFTGCLYLDSDVYLLENVARAWQLLGSNRVALSSPSPHILFIKDSEVLEQFCEYLLRLYRGDDLEALGEFCDLIMRADQAGQDTIISDMTLWPMFIERAKIPFCDLGKFEGTEYFDHSLGSPQERWEMLSDLRPLPEGVADTKNLRFREGQIFCRDKKLGRDRSYAALHCQGTRKYMIEHIASLRKLSIEKQTEFQLADVIHHFHMMA